MLQVHNVIEDLVFLLVVLNTFEALILSLFIVKLEQPTGLQGNVSKDFCNSSCTTYKKYYEL